MEKLNKVISIKYGKDHSDIENGDIPIYGSGGIIRYGNKSIYEKESVLIPRKGSLNNIIYSNVPFWTVDTMFYSELLIKNAAKYIYYFLSNINMELYNSGAALPSMTTDILYHFKIIIPPNELLEKFDIFVTALNSQLSTLNSQITNLRRQRDLLLPRLMSGKLEATKGN